MKRSRNRTAVARNAASGDMWLAGGSRVVLDHARLLGSSIRQLRAAPPPTAPGDRTFDRQSRLFGDRVRRSS